MHFISAALCGNDLAYPQSGLKIVPGLWWWVIWKAMWVLCKTRVWGQYFLRDIMSNELPSKATSPKSTFSMSLHGLCIIQGAAQEIPRHTDPCWHWLPLL